MAKIGRVCKEYMVKALTEKLKNSSNIFVTNCTGLSVADLEKLRAILRPNKVSYVIVKNSLSRLALKNVKAEELAPLIEGTVGLALGGTDPILTSKALINFSKETDKLKVKGGILDGKLISEAEIKTLSALPPKEILLSILFGGMKAPISGFVNV
ncbi:MAG: 50S ribosomal protein L10, partial [Candidatus Omnitrophica bacterium]|nr:50S ribosomal protein L10 [Candidatus Omnitrophota bacterium]